MLLTAAHVVGSLSAAHGIETGEVRLMTGPATGSADPRIGDVAFSSPPEPEYEIELDASLVRVDSHVSLDNHVRETVTTKRPRMLDGGEDYVRVFKRGINPPGLTEGLLDPTPQSTKVDLPGPGGRLTEHRYQEGWFVVGVHQDHPFARPGDSGAIVIDEDDCVVGMVVAVVTENPNDMKPTDSAFVIPISALLDGLAVEIVGPNRPCTVA